MSHIESGGGGRQTTLELNLVPFIDLMSVLITFLLITAVWSQVSMIQIGSSVYGQKSSDSPTPITPEMEIVLKVEVKPTGYQLTVGKENTNIPLVGGEFDDQELLGRLKIAKQKNPTKIDGAISMADDLPYERLIRAMDAFLKAGFSQISVLTGGPN